MSTEQDSSSESDSEGRVRNVSRLILRPPGHSGKAKRGHLLFDAAFESGNLGRVDRINEFEYDLFVRPDIANPRYRFWFNFTIQNAYKNQQNREIHLLTIGSKQLHEESSKIKPKIVIITGRVHPSETPSSYVCEGIINFLLSDHPMANCLRRYVTFHIIPMINPDGVFIGNTRTSVIGSDLNRSWLKSSPLMHPELVAAKEALYQITETSKEDVDLYLDLHAHTNILGACIYGFRKEDVFDMERHALFPKLLSHMADDFYIDNTIYSKEPPQSGSSRDYMASIFHNKANCYTLEVSYYGYYDKSTLGHTIIPYTESKYMHLGENVGIALLNCYRTIGHIPSSEIPTESLRLLSHSADSTQSQTDNVGNFFKLLDPISKLTVQEMGGSNN